ncbi:protein of unknown function DUF111 [Desulforamulus reducens MI-1]|uniref:Nickel insertion protein n=1 Tax=Desulforamulus reducens (strain ATCC BAA-1160 / DSM 100696 / MI-1) TaxID=349161 RepID=A4J9R4_DESRM|nr:LarC family nickel insertion protein [Desulforamulus reducens]ABO51817.1 protein of unknown function DUF111 [Desulforamulus reducens MI-1]
MKILLIDGSCGLKLDIFLGALLHTGVNEKTVHEEIKKLNLNYQLKVTDESLSLSSAKRVELMIDEPSNMTINYLISLIETSGLKPKVKTLVSDVLLRLSFTMARLNNIPLAQVFIEASLKKLILLIAIAIAVEELAPKKIFLNSLSLGSGMINLGESYIPIPSPVTAELLKGLPVSFGPVEGELVGPVEASLVNTLVDEYSFPSSFIPHLYGYGLGDLKSNNFHALRVIIGTKEERIFLTDEIAVLETNIDDMNPEFYPYIQDKFLKSGALDVFLTPIIMKKGRPGVKLSVLCKPFQTEKLCNLLLTETSSLGVRICYQNRKIAHRETKKVETRFGLVTVKVARLRKDAPILRITPEYEDCKRIALDQDIPIGEVYSETMKASEILVTNNF